MTPDPAWLRESAIQDKPSVYREELDGEEVTIIRASAIGNCLSSLVRQGLGITAAPPPDFMLEKFEEGHLAEPELLQSVEWIKSAQVRQVRGVNTDDMLNLIPEDELEEYGYSVRDGQVEVEIQVGSSTFIRCHPDGIASVLSVPARFEDSAYPGVAKGSHMVVEAKAFGKDMYDKFRKSGIEAFDYYAWQLSIEMHGTGLPALYIFGQKEYTDDGEYVRVDPKSIRHLYFPKAPVSLAKIKARAAKIAKAVDKGEIPECDVRSFPCGYYRESDTLCGGSTDAPVAVQVTEAAPDVDEDKLKEALDHWWHNESVANEKSEKLARVLKKRAELIQAFIDADPDVQKLDRAVTGLDEVITIAREEANDAKAKAEGLVVGKNESAYVIQVGDYTYENKESRGRVSWKGVAEELGAKEGDDTVEKHRGDSKFERVIKRMED